jgi:hypothetical protein
MTWPLRSQFVTLKPEPGSDPGFLGEDVLQVRRRVLVEGVTDSTGTGRTIEAAPATAREVSAVATLAPIVAEEAEPAAPGEQGHEQDLHDQHHGVEHGVLSFSSGATLRGKTLAGK